jgi:hypothetical protein
VTANQVNVGTRIDSAAQSLVEDNCCARIEAGSACADSDVAGYLTTAAQCWASCRVCGYPALAHTDAELMGCYEYYNKEER